MATGCLLGSGRESPGLATLLLRWDCSGSGLEMGSQGLVRALLRLAMGWLLGFGMEG